MTNSQLNSRLKYTARMISKWRSVLQIDSRWVIKNVYIAERNPKFPSDICWFDDSQARYYIITLNWYPPAFEGNDWKSEVEEYVAHELLHLFMWPLTSFAENMMSSKCQPELVKLEEGIVQTLMHILVKGEKK